MQSSEDYQSILLVILNARDSLLDVVSPSMQPLRKDVAALMSRMDSQQQQQQQQRRDIEQATGFSSIATEHEYVLTSNHVFTETPTARYLQQPQLTPFLRRKIFVSPQRFFSLSSLESFNALSVHLCLSAPCTASGGGGS